MSVEEFLKKYPNAELEISEEAEGEYFSPA